MSLNTGDTVSLTIEKLVYGSYGLSYFDKLVVFVPYTVPGEEIKAKIVQRKKDYAVGTVVEITTSSDDRIVPKCPNYGVCGGCNYQHMTYKRQLEQKKSIVSDLFSRIPGIEQVDIPSVLASPAEFNYRNRTSLKVKICDNVYKTGFYEKGTHQLSEFEECLLLHPSLNEAIKTIKAAIKNDNFLRLKIKDINLHYSSSTGEVNISIYTDAYNAGLMNELVSGLNSIKTSGIIFYTHNKRKVFGKDYNLEELNGINLKISDKSFSQINWLQNQTMVEKALSFAELNGDENILDLYSGIGNFSLPFARNCKTVKGIEGSVHSYQDAVHNSTVNNISNCTFLQDDTEKGVKKLLNGKKVKDFSIILINPPRTGATKDLLMMVKNISPEKIIYISCDPSTLSRDVKILSAEGYTLKKMQSLDLFPQTYHIETVACLGRD